MFSLRSILFVLILLNLLYAGYTRGWLGIGPEAQDSVREPHRLAQQIEAAKVGVTALPLTSPLANTPQAPTSGAAEEAAPVSDTAQTSDPASRARCAQSAQRWLIYMGPYTVERMRRKRSELDRLHVRYTEVSTSSLPSGLQLGVYRSEEEAKAALVGFARKGVKTATVVLWDSDCANQ